MDTIVNILMIVSGFVGAITGIGGKTWLENSSSFLRRITTRGRIAIACLIATLSLGVVKEIRTNAAIARAADEKLKLTIQLADARAKLEDSRRLTLLALQALPISNSFKKDVAGHVETLAIKKGYPAPNITYYEHAIIFDFKDDDGKRVGYVYLGQEDLVAQMSKDPGTLDDELDKFLFDDWASLNLDIDWDLIRDRLSDFASTILEKRFHTDNFMDDNLDDKTGMLFFPVNSNGAQLSNKKLTISRNELTNMLTLSNIRIGAKIADLAEHLP